jgi:nicotinate-nucleotide adenylyltransferase
LAKRVRVHCGEDSTLNVQLSTSNAQFASVSVECSGLSVKRWALKKIGIYGGTFDPVHHAHLILAREALETLGLAKVILVPAAISPLKKAAPIASAELRLAMLRAAIQGEQEFEVNECELRRRPPSYTIETVEQIQRSERDAAFYWLVGEDNVEQLPQWHRFAELEKIVRFIVLDRTGKQPSHSYQVIHRRLDISATEIRRRVAQNRSIRYLVPESVAEIIQREKLYQE